MQVVAEVDHPKYVSLTNSQPKSLQRLLVLERVQDPGNLVCTVQLWMLYAALGDVFQVVPSLLTFLLVTKPHAWHQSCMAPAIMSNPLMLLIICLRPFVLFGAAFVARYWMNSFNDSRIGFCGDLRDLVTASE